MTWQLALSFSVFALFSATQARYIKSLQGAHNALTKAMTYFGLICPGITQDFRGANSYRPNITCDPLLPADQRSPTTGYFNAACVTLPTDPSQPFGNASRNAARGDAIYQLDLALSKSFGLRRDSRLEFRAEAFNVLNKTNFRAPSGNRSASTFGTVTSTYDPRQIQLGVKFSF